ncbi:MAG: hypothetical protein Q8Q85_09785 [Gemmatimonadales bacterium]|nr:hypothetical protein [Gemmatimonadales bacterium]
MLRVERLVEVVVYGATPVVPGLVQIASLEKQAADLERKSKYTAYSSHTRAKLARDARVMRAKIAEVKAAARARSMEKPRSMPRQPRPGDLVDMRKPRSDKKAPGMPGFPAWTQQDKDEVESETDPVKREKMRKLPPSMWWMIGKKRRQVSRAPSSLQDAPRRTWSIPAHLAPYKNRLPPYPREPYRAWEARVKQFIAEGHVMSSRTMSAEESARYRQMRPRRGPRYWRRPIPAQLMLYRAKVPPGENEDQDAWERRVKQLIAEELARRGQAYPPSQAYPPVVHRGPRLVPNAYPLFPSRGPSTSAQDMRQDARDLVSASTSAEVTSEGVSANVDVSVDLPLWKRPLLWIVLLGGGAAYYAYTKRAVLKSKFTVMRKTVGTPLGKGGASKGAATP